MRSRGLNYDGEKLWESQGKINKKNKNKLEKYS